MAPTPSRGDEWGLALKISEKEKSFSNLFRQRKVLAETKPEATVVGKKRRRGRGRGREIRSASEG